MNSVSGVGGFVKEIFTLKTPGFQPKNSAVKSSLHLSFSFQSSTFLRVVFSEDFGE